MRIITWSVHGALSDSPVWQLLSELQPDIALLQEVGGLPEMLRNTFACCLRHAASKNGKPQRFRTGVLVRGKIVAEIMFSSAFDWVNRELEFFAGNLIGCTVKPLDRDPLNVISVYSPAWPVNRDRLRGIDVSWIKLAGTNPDVWGTDILWGALKNTALIDSEWVIGGDFNSSETFDCDWQDKNNKRFGIRSSGNAATLERMRRLGFTECLRRNKEDPIIPTFKHSRGGAYHQMDHLFVSNGLVSRLERCKVGDQAIIFGKSLSDHLPVIADFGRKGLN